MVEVNLETVTEWALKQESELDSSLKYREKLKRDINKSPKEMREVLELSNERNELLYKGARSSLTNLYETFPAVKTAVDKYKAEQVAPKVPQ